MSDVLDATLVALFVLGCVWIGGVIIALRWAANNAAVLFTVGVLVVALISLLSAAARR